ncbi:MAG: HlyD family efflux transporter periplasmic adaptor subunit, partial [Planctomycetota bacterium]
MRKLVAHTTRRRLALAAVACGAAIAAAQGPPPRPVAVAEVVERDIPPSIRLVGTILPERSAVIAAEVSGVVAEFIASEGDFLHTGDPICKLDDAVARLELAAAEARLGELQAKLTELENGTRPETLRQLEAAVGEAKAIYEMWRFERQRIEELYKQNQSSAKERNDTEQEFRAAERRFAQRTAAYEEARNGPRTEEIDAARFEVAAQQAVVARLRRDLEKTVIRAPFDGFVTRKRTEVGQWLAAGGPAAEMVAIDTVRIRADVPEEAAPFT